MQLVRVVTHFPVERRKQLLSFTTILQFTLTLILYKSIVFNLWLILSGVFQFGDNNIILLSRLQIFTDFAGHFTAMKINFCTVKSVSERYLAKTWNFYSTNKFRLYSNNQLQYSEYAQLEIIIINYTE